MSLPYVGIELGGTKVVVGTGTGPGIHAVRRIATTTPADTLAAVAGYVRRQADSGGLAGIGIASFGPVDLTPGSATYGRILATPKPGWAGTDVVAAVAPAAPGVPVAFDTDVNAAALAEHRWGAGVGLAAGPLLYLTVGTGIGGGVVLAGRPWHGISHPEMGHVPVPHDVVLDPFPGCCPFHGDCLEGLACGPAIAQRWGVPAEHLPAEHPAWALEAGYLAAGLQSLVLTLMPARVVVGGGVAGTPGLLARVRKSLRARLGGYGGAPQLHGEGMESYVVPPRFGDMAGVLGAIALCQPPG